VLEASEKSQTVPGARQAAIFLMGVSDQIGTFSALHSVEPHHMLGVFREFETLAVRGQLFAKGGVERGRRLAEQALGPEFCQKILQTSVPDGSQGPAELEILQDTDPQQLASFVRDEHPQVIALILSHLPAAQAVAVMSSLPEAIGSKLKNIKQVKRSDGIRALAGLLNKVDPAMVETILAKPDEEDQTIGTSVRDMMFGFEDVRNINKEGMTKLIAKVDRKIRTTALKGTFGKVRDHFKQCMSQRAAEMLDEDMKALGPVRIRDVEAAQQQLVAVVRQLQQEGVLYVSQGGGDEYVV
jgi:flagellar motor switch protein FliG